MTMAPADSRRATANAGALRLIGEGRTGGRGRQAGDVDIVLDHERDAVERLAAGTCKLKRRGHLQRLLLGPDRDEQGGIGMVRDAGVGRLDRRGDRASCGVTGDQGGNQFAQASVSVARRQAYMTMAHVCLAKTMR